MEIGGIIGEGERERGFFTDSSSLVVWSSQKMSRVTASPP